MSSQRQLGTRYEKIAANYLCGNGCKLVAQNFHCRAGEIDIIVLDGRTLVFAEVKYRTSKNFGHPAETVTSSKQKKLIRSAYFFLQQNQKYSTYDARFDIISISPQSMGDEPDIQWFRGAFTT